MSIEIEKNSSNEELEKYISDLKLPWKTMDSDMETAFSIISRYDNDNLELLSVSQNEQSIRIQFPDWQSEVENVFVDQYGTENGRHVFRKVVMRLFQLSKGSAEHLH